MKGVIVTAGDDSKLKSTVSTEVVKLQVYNSLNSGIKWRVKVRVTL